MTYARIFLPIGAKLLQQSHIIKKALESKIITIKYVFINIITLHIYKLIWHNFEVVLQYDPVYFLTKRKNQNDF